MESRYLNRPIERQHIILLGNGINRLFSNNSWRDIIIRQCEKNNIIYNESYFDDIPYNMQIVAATNDSVDKSMKELCSEMNAADISEKQKNFIKKILSMTVNDILTCNYTYELEKTISAKKKYHPETLNGKSGSDNMMLFNPIVMEHEEQIKNIWHIHGHIGAPNSVIMGHYYYGNLLAKIREYVPTFIRRYKGSAEFGKCTVKSWVDLFLTSDVHIIGLGMDFSEMDLWWLVCCKKRNFSDTKIYFYEASEDLAPSKRMLMNAYGIETPELHRNSLDHFECYEHILDLINKKIDTVE